MKRRMILVTAVLLALTLALTSCAASGPVIADKNLKAGTIQHLTSYSAILKLLKQSGGTNRFYMRVSAMGAPEAALDSKSGNDYSTTNVQVAGVDEADVVKTDGTHLYLIANGRLIVVDAVDPAAMKVVATLTFSTETNEYPIEMYLDTENQRLSLILGSYRPIEPTPTTEGTPAVEPQSKGGIASDMIRPGMWYWGGMSTTEVKVYDISDATKPSLVRSFEQEGSYLSSRRIGTDLYLITNRYTWYDLATTVESMIPSVREGTTSTWDNIPASSIGIVKSNDYSNFLIVSGLDTVETGKDADTKALLGAGNVLYASTDYLYVAVGRWVQQEVTPVATTGTGTGTETNPVTTEPGTSSGDETPPPTGAPDTGTTDPTAPDAITPDPVVTSSPDTTTVVESKEIFQIFPMPVVETFTDVFRFRISDAKVTEDGVGSVPGYILNQFSMDESDGYFRIATTVGDAWRNDQYTSMNGLYVLDASMKTVGRIEGLASRETIKSVRFLGSKAYMVTFQTTDPLFVIDLSVPTAPKVSGELKIPGYSEYLHPYADGMLLGFGKDAVVQGEMAFYLGMKFSMFDVSDPTDPREIAKFAIGDRGTYSEVSYNQKALLFSKEKNVIGIPIVINRVPKDQSSDPIAYGQPVFQGFLVLGYDAERGIYIRGLITHAKTVVDYTQEFKSYEDIYAKVDQESMWGSRMVTRGLYINDTLFTISAGSVHATSLTDFSAIGSVDLPGAQEYYGEVKPVD